VARRERTTGLPRQRRRQAAAARTQRFQVSESTGRLIILATAAALLVLVLGLFITSWWHNSYGHGRETVVQVGEERFSLEYYAKRLLLAAQADPSQGIGITQQQLLNTLEQEGLAVELARKNGIDLSDNAINQRIAEVLGVPYGGTGTPFDTAYRARLRIEGVSDTFYRKKTKADLAVVKLQEFYASQSEGKVETVQIRLVESSTKDIADAAYARIQAGEDLGLIAEKDSIDVSSRATQGLKSEQPIDLFPEEVRTALQGKNPGDLIGPVKVGDTYWIIRLEKRNPEGEATDAQRDLLAAARYKDELQAFRTTVPITRSFDAGDAAWALENAN
jgi:parvulin-like peptidyl-prolyl isomerase